MPERLDSRTEEEFSRLEKKNRPAQIRAKKLGIVLSAFVELSGLAHVLSRINEADPELADKAAKMEEERLEREYEERADDVLEMAAVSPDGLFAPDWGDTVPELQQQLQEILLTPDGTINQEVKHKIDIGHLILAYDEAIGDLDKKEAEHAHQVLRAKRDQLKELAKTKPPSEVFHAALQEFKRYDPVQRDLATFLTKGVGQCNSITWGELSYLQAVYPDINFSVQGFGGNYAGHSQAIAPIEGQMFVLDFEKRAAYPTILKPGTVLEDMTDMATMIANLRNLEAASGQGPRMVNGAVEALPPIDAQKLAAAKALNQSVKRSSLDLFAETAPVKPTAGYSDIVPVADTTERPQLDYAQAMAAVEQSNPGTSAAQAAADAAFMHGREAVIKAERAKDAHAGIYRLMQEMTANTPPTTEQRRRLYNYFTQAKENNKLEEITKELEEITPIELVGTFDEKTKKRQVLDSNALIAKSVLKVLQDYRDGKPFDIEAINALKQRVATGVIADNFVDTTGESVVVEINSQLLGELIALANTSHKKIKALEMPRVEFKTFTNQFSQIDFDESPTINTRTLAQSLTGLEGFKGKKINELTLGVRNVVDFSALDGVDFAKPPTFINVPNEADLSTLQSSKNVSPVFVDPQPQVDFSKLPGGDFSLTLGPQYSQNLDSRNPEQLKHCRILNLDAGFQTLNLTLGGNQNLESLVILNPDLHQDLSILRTLPHLKKVMLNFTDETRGDEGADRDGFDRFVELSRQLPEVVFDIPARIDWQLYGLDPDHNGALMLLSEVQLKDGKCVDSKGEEDFCEEKPNGELAEVLSEEVKDILRNPRSVPDPVTAINEKLKLARQTGQSMDLLSHFNNYEVRTSSMELYLKTVFAESERAGRHQDM